MALLKIMNEEISAGKVWIKPDDPAFSYEGRIDFENPQAPVFVYPCSYVSFVLRGKKAGIAIENHRAYFQNSLGVLVDGAYRGKFILHDEPGLYVYDLSAFLKDGEHVVTVYKRMDACHYFTFYGLVTEENAFVGKMIEKPARRMEVYGDSVSAGEVSEAVGRCGMSDPDGHDGIYSNSFYSYPWILARRINARLHDVAQGGISLHDGEGWFEMPNTVGMESCYDKIELNPSLGARKPWDFEKYTPHVVLVAIGQNDAHPEDYMAGDYDGEKAKGWRADYAAFLGKLRSHYPKALIVCTTTILGHEPAWDQAIDQVCNDLGDPKIKHFMYSKTGCGTCGHIRIPEAEEMAAEMAEFLNGFGEEIWMD